MKKIYCPVCDYSCLCYNNGVCTLEDPSIDCDEFIGYFLEEMEDEDDEDEDEDDEDE